MDHSHRLKPCILLLGIAFEAEDSECRRSLEHTPSNRLFNRRWRASSPAFFTSGCASGLHGFSADILAERIDASASFAATDAAAALSSDHCVTVTRPPADSGPRQRRACDCCEAVEIPLNKK